MRAARGEEKGVSGRRWSMTTTAWVDAGAAVQPLPARTQTAAVRTHGVLRRRGRTRSAAQRRGSATAQRACLRDGGVVSHAHPPRRPSPRAPPAPSPALRNGVTAAVPVRLKQPRVRLQEPREAAALAGSTGALGRSGSRAGTGSTTGWREACGRRGRSRVEARRQGRLPRAMVDHGL